MSPFQYSPTQIRAKSAFFQIQTFTPLPSVIDQQEYLPKKAYFPIYIHPRSSLSRRKKYNNINKHGRTIILLPLPAVLQVHMCGNKGGRNASLAAQVKRGERLGQEQGAHGGRNRGVSSDARSCSATRFAFVTHHGVCWGFHAGNLFFSDYIWRQIAPLFPIRPGRIFGASDPWSVINAGRRRCNMQAVCPECQRFLATESGTSHDIPAMHANAAHTFVIALASFISDL